MANVRIRTLWTMRSRVTDSREVLDSTGLGVKVGRVDIDGSLMVVHEGYTKVLYKRYDSTGKVEEFDSIEEALTFNGVKPAIETKLGSGVMTFFISNLDVKQSGLNSIEIHKEFEDTDPEPEQDTVVSVYKVGGFDEFGFAVQYQDGRTITYWYTGRDLSAALPKSSVFNYYTTQQDKQGNAIEALEKRITELEAAKPTE